MEVENFAKKNPLQVVVPYDNFDNSKVHEGSSSVFYVKKFNKFIAP